MTRSQAGEPPYVEYGKPQTPGGSCVRSLLTPNGICIQTCHQEVAGRLRSHPVSGFHTAPGLGPPHADKWNEQNQACWIYGHLFGAGSSVGHYGMIREEGEAASPAKINTTVGSDSGSRSPPSPIAWSSAHPCHPPSPNQAGHLLSTASGDWTPTVKSSGTWHWYISLH